MIKFEEALSQKRLQEFGWQDITVDSDNASTFATQVKRIQQNEYTVFIETSSFRDNTDFSIDIFEKIDDRDKPVCSIWEGSIGRDHYWNISGEEFRVPSFMRLNQEDVLFELLKSPSLFIDMLIHTSAFFDTMVVHYD